MTKAIRFVPMLLLVLLTTIKLSDACNRDKIVVGR